MPGLSKSRPYAVAVDVTNVRNLVPFADVQVAGVTVGTVHGIERRGKALRLDLRLDPVAAPLHGRGAGVASAAAAMLGIARLRVDTGTASFLPAGDPSVAAMEDKARAFGGDPIVVILESAQPRELLLDQRRLLRLLGLPAGLPTLHNSGFVRAVVFDQQTGAVRPQWRFVVPDDDKVTLLVRPRERLDREGTRQLVDAVARRGRRDRAAHPRAALFGGAHPAAGLGTALAARRRAGRHRARSRCARLAGQAAVLRRGGAAAGAARGGQPVPGSPPRSRHPRRAGRAERVLGSSGEVSVVLTGSPGAGAADPAALDWARRAQTAVVTGFGTELRSVLTLPDLLAFLGPEPTPQQVRAALDLLPGYLSSALVTTHRDAALMIFGVRLGDLGEQAGLLEAVRAALPPHPPGRSVMLAGLPVAAAEAYRQVSEGRYLANLAGVVVAGVVLAAGLRRRAEALGAVAAAVLATGWGLAVLAAAASR